MGKHEDDLDSCYDQSWIGVARSLEHVSPDLNLTILYQDRQSWSQSSGIDKIIAEANYCKTNCGVVSYRQHRRYITAIKALAAPDNQPARLKQGGVYLITGGLGGLGKNFAAYLAKTCKAKLMLTGRTKRNDQSEAVLQELKTQGATEAKYYAVNVSHEQELAQCLAEIQSTYGKLNGIIHAAGVGSQKTFENRTEQDIAEVVNPKLQGTLLLDELTKAIPLDFVCYFSSTSAILGDGGSCDYALANRFQIHYGSYRQALEAEGKRHGKTIVINWPLWSTEAGGMNFADEEQIKFYLQSSGQEALGLEEGLAAWQKFLAADSGHYIFFKGQEKRIKQFLDRIYEPYKKAELLQIQL